MLRIGSTIIALLRSIHLNPPKPMKFAVGLFALMVGCAAWSQSTHTIKVVVPYPAGGFADILARILADQVGRAREATVMIENRPGAGSVIGTEAVSRAAPDGKTLLLTGNPFVISPHLRTLAYDPLTSFAPICSVARVPTIFAVVSTSPYRTFGDLLSAARLKPGQLTLASVGPASATQIAFELLKRAAHIDMTFVPFPGGAPAINALLGEHVTVFFGNYSDASDLIASGKLRALAVASRERVEFLPNVPTVAESGYSQFDVEIWLGVLAPAKTPPEMVFRLAHQFTAALAEPGVKPRLHAQGFVPDATCGADFATLLQRQYEDYGRVSREANIRGE